MAERRHRLRRWLLIGGLLMAVVLGGAAAFVYWPRPPTPISEQDAIDQFRADAGGSSTAAGPVAGVYTYDAEGTEKISLGPLPLPTRDIPGTVTVVVRPEADGCYLSTLNLMGEHTEATTWCVGPDGSLELRRQEKQEQVPGFDVSGVTTCDPGTVIAATEGAVDVRCTLLMDVSGLKLTVAMEGTATVGDSGVVEVGGVPVPTRHVVLAMAASGDLSGHWNEEYWLTADLVPVRIVRDVVLADPGSFDEQTDLALRSLTPLT